MAARVTFDPIVRYRTVNVYDDGSIDPIDFIDADTGDVIVWLMINTTPLTVKVKLKEFRKYKSNGQPGNIVTPMDFFQDSCTIDPNSLPGVIAGQLIYLPPPSAPLLETKYTISVKVDSGGWIDTDPDLDINRP